MSGKGTGWISIAALVGLLAGGFLGYQFPNVMGLVGVFGKFFVYALVILALVQFATSFLLASEQIGQRAKLGRIVLRVVGLYMAMGLAGGLLGMLATVLIGPGEGINQIVTDLHQGWAPMTGFSLSPEVLGGVVVLVLCLGAGLIGLGARFRAVSSSIEQIHQMASNSVSMMTIALPFGLMALAAGLVGSDEMLRISIAAVTGAGPAAAGLMMNSVWGYLGLVIGGLLVIGFVLLPLAVRLFGNMPIGSMFANLAPAMTVAFGSGSSLTAYPFLQTSLVEKLNTDNRVAGLVLPLGNLLNVTATSFVTVVAMLFLAQAAQIELTLVHYAAILLAPLLLAIGRVGLPAMMLVTLSSLIAILGFSVEIMAGLGMILIVDWLVDRVRAVVNVMSDVTVVSIAGEFFEFKTARAGREISRPQAQSRDRKDFSSGRSDRDRSGSDKRRFDRQEGRSEGPRSEGRSDHRRGREDRPTERRHNERQSEPRSSQRRDRDDRGRDSRGRKRPSDKSPFEMSAEQAPQFDVDLSKKPTSAAPRRNDERRTSESTAPRQERRKSPRSSDATKEKRERDTARVKPESEKSSDSSSPASRPRTRTRTRPAPDAAARDISRVGIHHDPVGEKLLSEKADEVNETPEKLTADLSRSDKHAEEKPTSDKAKSQLTIDLPMSSKVEANQAVSETKDTPDSSGPSGDAVSRVGKQPKVEPAIPVEPVTEAKPPTPVEPKSVTPVEPVLPVEPVAPEPVAEAEPPTPTFGRSRSRRAKPKPADQAKPPTPAEPVLPEPVTETKPPTPVEPVNPVGETSGTGGDEKSPKEGVAKSEASSFGRGKRKKVR